MVWEADWLISVEVDSLLQNVFQWPDPFVRFLARLSILEMIIMIVTTITPTTKSPRSVVVFCPLFGVPHLTCGLVVESFLIAITPTLSSLVV